MDDGRRAWKAASGTKTYFLYSGTTPVCELDASGNVTAVNTFGSGLISRHTTSDTFYTFDPQGNVVQRVGSGGIPTSIQDYTAFGQTVSSFGPTTQPDPFGYHGSEGYYTDRETGLLYLTHRYYDPTRARFLNRDPLGYGGGINLYGYCGNDPVGESDPDGYNPWNPNDPDFGVFHGHDYLQNAVDFSAGMGDTISFGGTKIARAAIGNVSGLGDLNDTVQYCSTGYMAGEVAGIVHSLLMGRVSGGLGMLGRLRAIRTIKFANISGLGSTDAYGNITLKVGLAGKELEETLRHELVHRFFSVSEGGLLSEQRANFMQWTYNNSSLLRYAEEAMAETYGVRSLVNGLKFPIEQGYVTVRGMVGEGLGVGAAGYGIYWLDHRLRR